MADTLFPQKILSPETAFVDKDGKITKDWWLFLYNMSGRTLGTAGDDQVLLAQVIEVDADSDVAFSRASIAELQNNIDTELPSASLADLNDANAMAWFWQESDIGSGGGGVGPAGPAGPTGAAGTAGPAVFLEAEPAEDPIMMPGPQGIPGTQGIQGAAGAVGPAVFLEAEQAEDPIYMPGAPGAQGIQGVSGFPGSDGESAEDPLIIPGPIGPQGATGATGPTAATVFFGSAKVDLGVGRLSGTSIIEAKFLASQVGKPVMIQQAGGSDEDEHNQVLCTGKILNTRQLQMRWLSNGIIRGSRSFNYIISP